MRAVYKSLAIISVVFCCQEVVFAQLNLEASQAQPQMQQRHLIITNVRSTDESTVNVDSGPDSCDSACQGASKKTDDAALMLECQARSSSYAICKSEER